MARLDINIPDAFLPILCKTIDSNANNRNEQIQDVRNYILEMLRSMYIEGSKRKRELESVSEAVSIE